MVEPSTSPPKVRDATQRRRRTEYRESTLGAIVLGLAIGSIMSAAVTYAGLKIGFTIVSSAIASVLGFGILRGLLRRGTILEINIVQTAASAVDSTAAGVIFTVPVLWLLGSSITAADRSLWAITLACGAGAVVGCAFIIPLRKQMIDIDRLRFPSGTAVAAILRSPGAGPKKSLVLLAGAVVAIVIYLPVGLSSIQVKVSLEELQALVESGELTPGEAEQTRQIVDWLAQRQLPPALVEQGHRLAREIETGRHSSEPNDLLALTAYRISAGEEPWEALKQTNLWAARPLWDYGRLGWRLRDPREDIRDGRAAGLPLARRIDRDGDDWPDLVLSGDSFDLGRLIGLPEQFQLVLAIAPFALGAGYLSGQAGLMILAGGVLAFFILNPAALALGWMPATVDAAGAADYAYGALNRPLGIGMLLGGALMGIIAALPAMVPAIQRVRAAGRIVGSSDELGFKTVAAAVIVCLALLYAATGAVHVEGTADNGLLAGWNPHVARMVVALVGTAWIWFAGMIVAQCTGMTDWQPVSGMALVTIALVMSLLGSEQVAGAVLVGATLCCAIACSSELMTDLKTGYLVGSLPRRQQVVQLSAAFAGPIISVATLLVIVTTNTRTFGIPIGPGTQTTAPQAQALHAVMVGVQGGEMPYALYICGIVLGMAMGVGTYAGLGVLIGLSMYLPIVYTLTYGVGCLANMAVVLVKGRTWSEEWGVPFCAGLIVGEALLALVINSIVLVRG